MYLYQIFSYGFCICVSLGVFIKEWVLFFVIASYCFYVCEYQGSPQTQVERSRNMGIWGSFRSVSARETNPWLWESTGHRWFLLPKGLLALFIVSVNKLLNKQSNLWWFETLRCAYAVTVMHILVWLKLYLAKYLPTVKTSSIVSTKSKNINVSCFVLRLSLPKSIEAEQRR